MTGALSQKVAYKNKLLIFHALADFILLKIIYKLSNIPYIKMILEECDKFHPNINLKDLPYIFKFIVQKKHLPIYQFATIFLMHIEVE